MAARLASSALTGCAVVHGRLAGVPRRSRSRSLRARGAAIRPAGCPGRRRRPGRERRSGVPGGAFVRAVAGRLGPGRLGRVIVAVQLPVGADVSGAVLPVQPVERVIGHRAERAHRPRRRALGDVLGRQFGEDDLPLPVGLDSAGFFLPDRVEHGQVIGVGQGPGSGVQGRLPQVFQAENVGSDRDGARVLAAARRWRAARPRRAGPGGRRRWRGGRGPGLGAGRCAGRSGGRRVRTGGAPRAVHRRSQARLRLGPTSSRAARPLGRR